MLSTRADIKDPRQEKSHRLVHHVLIMRVGAYGQLPVRREPELLFPFPGGQRDLDSATHAEERALRCKKNKKLRVRTMSGLYTKSMTPEGNNCSVPSEREAAHGACAGGRRPRTKTTVSSGQSWADTREAKT